MNYLKTFEKYGNSDIDDILNQISNFLNSNLRNLWISNDEIEIFIRKSKRIFNGNTYDFFDFATINVTEPNNGLFTKILKKFEEKYPDKNIFIESVLTERFANYIKNVLKFEEETPNYSNNFYKIKSNKI
jgi:hypothetical protein